MSSLAQATSIPVGIIKQFGAAEPKADGKPRVRIVLVRTGEETTCGFEAMMEDPEAS